MSPTDKIMSWKGWEEVEFWEHCENDLLGFQDGIRCRMCEKKKEVKGSFYEVFVKWRLNWTLHWTNWGVTFERKNATGKVESSVWEPIWRCLAFSKICCVAEGSGPYFGNRQ